MLSRQITKKGVFMEEIKISAQTVINYDVYTHFKSALMVKNITISDWLKEKITEEANTVKITKAE